MAKIAVAGTGYVGLSLAVLLSQHNEITAVDIISEKVDLLNKWQSPIKDEYIEKFMAEHEERDLNLCATSVLNATHQKDNAQLQSNWRYTPCASPKIKMSR